VQAVREEKLSSKENKTQKNTKDMKRKLRIIISASAVSVMALSALAQDTPNPKTDRSDYARDGLRHPRQADRLNGAAKASDLIGMTVKNYQDEKLGKVNDLAVDVESGRIVQVILSTGGFAGIGDTLTAVPPGALHHDITQKVLHLEADKEKLKGAPRFENSKWAECCDSNHLSTVYTYYGEEPAFRFIHKGDAVLDGLRNPDGQINRDGQLNTDLQRTKDGLPNTVSTRRADGTWENDRALRESQSMIPVSRLSQVQKASKLMGTSVKNLHNEKLGDVENLLVDLPSGRIVAVIIGSGGFLGMGEELSAVPPTALRFNTDRDTLQLDTSKEMLSNAPHFKANQWPDFSQPTYADGVYRAYHVEPYFTTNTTTDVDNTRRNVRDRDDQTLTPLNQGNSKADVATTAQIRKEIIAGKNMSVNARNVKIITNNGRVTLRGPVNTAEEKRLIGEIAERIARSENVDNQLEVKLSSNN
jgi:hyperosmotically inducible periplasmic protein